MLKSVEDVVEEGSSLTTKVLSDSPFATARAAAAAAAVAEASSTFKRSTCCAAAAAAAFFSSNSFSRDNWDEILATVGLRTFRAPGVGDVLGPLVRTAVVSVGGGGLWDGWC